MRALLKLASDSGQQSFGDHVLRYAAQSWHVWQLSVESDDRMPAVAAWDAYFRANGGRLRDAVLGDSDDTGLERVVGAVKQQLGATESSALLFVACNLLLVVNQRGRTPPPPLPSAAHGSLLLPQMPSLLEIQLWLNAMDSSPGLADQVVLATAADHDQEWHAGATARNLFLFAALLVVPHGRTELAQKRYEQVPLPAISSATSAIRISVLLLPLAQAAAQIVEYGGVSNNELQFFVKNKLRHVGEEQFEILKPIALGLF
jgi:hypothetical protein